MVYAPRNEEEVEIVRRIVAAAVWWVGGVDVDQKFGEDAEEPLSEYEKEVQAREISADPRSCQVHGLMPRPS